MLLLFSLFFYSFYAQRSALLLDCFDLFDYSMLESITNNLDIKFDFILISLSLSLLNCTTDSIIRMFCVSIRFGNNYSSNINMY